MLIHDTQYKLIFSYTCMSCLLKFIKISTFRYLRKSAKKEVSLQTFSNLYRLGRDNPTSDSVRRRLCAHRMIFFKVLCRQLPVLRDVTVERSFFPHFSKYGQTEMLITSLSIVRFQKFFLQPIVYTLG